MPTGRAAANIRRGRAPASSSYYQVVPACSPLSGGNFQSIKWCKEIMSQWGFYRGPAAAIASTLCFLHVWHICCLWPRVAPVVPPSSHPAQQENQASRPRLERCRHDQEPHFLPRTTRHCRHWFSFFIQILVLSPSRAQMAQLYSPSTARYTTTSASENRSSSSTCSRQSPIVKC